MKDMYEAYARRIHNKSGFELFPGEGSFSCRILCHFK